MTQGDSRPGSAGKAKVRVDYKVKDRRDARRDEVLLQQVHQGHVTEVGDEVGEEDHRGDEATL